MDSKYSRVSRGELVQNYISEGSRIVHELFVMVRKHAHLREHRQSDVKVP
jgi:26S proteasome regulatory subunit T6